MINVIDTEIDGVKIIEPKLFGDARGYFFESFSQREFDEKVLKTVFVQDNESQSVAGVVRGLHFQKPPFTQAKLVRVVKGAVLDVAVDIRKGSPTFSKHVACLLSAENHRQFFVPRGFAQSEGAIAWDDPDLGIDWQVPTENRILSEKDAHHPRLKDAELVFDIHVPLY